MNLIVLMKWNRLKFFGAGYRLERSDGECQIEFGQTFYVEYKIPGGQLSVEGFVMATPAFSCPAFLTNHLMKFLLYLQPFGMRFSIIGQLN